MPISQYLKICENVTKQCKNKDLVYIIKFNVQCGNDPINFLGKFSVNKVFTSGWWRQGWSQGRFGHVILLAWSQRAKVRQKQAEAWKGRKSDFTEPCKQVFPCWHKKFSSVRLISDCGLWTCKILNLGYFDPRSMNLLCLELEATTQPN